MSNLPNIALPIALVVLAACRSESIHSDARTPARSTASMAGAAPQILTESVSASFQFDGSHIFLRQGNEGLLVLETEWSGENLVSELKSELFDQFSARNSGREMSLWLDVRRFNSMPGEYAEIDVAWRLHYLNSEGKLLSKTCRTKVQSPAGSTMNDLAFARQRNVQGLVIAILEEIHSTQEGCLS